jgi:hypothetical protein
VNRSAVTFGVISLLTVARTSTSPALCAGETTVHSVIELQLTDVAAVTANLKLVAVVPGAKPVPVTMTLVPPAAGPLLGATEVIVRGPNLKRSAVEVARNEVLAAGPE